MASRSWGGALGGYGRSGRGPGGAAPATSIELPILNPREGDHDTVELAFSELPELSDLLLVLKHEQAALSIWLAVAVRQMD